MAKHEGPPAESWKDKSFYFSTLFGFFLVFFAEIKHIFCSLASRFHFFDKISKVKKGPEKVEFKV